VFCDEFREILILELLAGAEPNTALLLLIVIAVDTPFTVADR